MEGALPGPLWGEPVVEMKGINSSYVALEFYYQIQRQDAAGKPTLTRWRNTLRSGTEASGCTFWTTAVPWRSIDAENLEAGTNDLSLGVAETT